MDKPYLLDPLADRQVQPDQMVPMEVGEEEMGLAPSLLGPNESRGALPVQGRLRQDLR